MSHPSSEYLDTIFAELHGAEHPHLDSLQSQLQDIEIPPSTLVSLLSASLSEDTHPLALRKVLTLLSMLDSYEEFAEGIQSALAESLSGDGECARFVRALLTRLQQTSSTQWEVGVAATGSMGSLVGQAKLADAHQPRGGVLGAVASALPPPVSSPPTQTPGGHFCAPATRYVSSSRRGAGPPYEELKALRGLLAWTWCHCPLARRVLEGEVREVLVGVGSGRVGESVSYALSALLDFVSALCASGQGVLFNARTPNSAQGIVDSILALFSSRVTRRGLGFNALQCFLTPFFPQASSLLLSILKANPSLSSRAVDSLLNSATSALLESSTRATTVLQLLQSVVGVAGALALEGGDDGKKDSASAPPLLHPSLLPFVLSCAVSDNSAIARTSLSFFSLPSWCSWVVTGGGLSATVRALLKGGALTPHWNATVNKFTRSALEALEEAAGKEEFTLAVVSIIPPSSPSPPLPTTTTASLPNPAIPPISTSSASSLQASKGLVPSRPPPSLNPLPTSSVAWKGASSGQPPPLTITGVAPWAMAKKLSSPPAVSATTSSGGSVGGRSLTTPLPPSTTPSSPYERYQWYLNVLVPPPSPSSLSTSGNGGMGSSIPPPLSPSPMLLPHLSFHDLVWGEDLGSGTYCTVTAARHILKGAPQRQWPLYAVKKVSAEALHGGNVYRGAVARELTVLSLLTHPATSRLVCAYRWRGGLHMVQEHAGVTDLHRYIELAGHQGGGGGGGGVGLGGGVKEEEARWIIGEVGAALGYLHSIGFAYGDCKPENVVLWVGEEAERLTQPEEGGGGGRGLHCKLVDFAACRPLQGGGEELLLAQAQLLQGVRDGEWKKPGGSSASANDGSGGGGGSLDLAQEIDERIEGTLEYLAPELCGGEGVGGGYPTIASDAYALGVTLYQLLAGGKFPDTVKMWGGSEGGDTVALTAQRRRVGGGGGVGFSSHIRVLGEEEGGGKGGEESSGAFPSDFPKGAADLVRALLHPEPTQRLGGGSGGLAEVFQHPWLAPLGDVNTLHSRVGPPVPPLLLSTYASLHATTNKNWMRRHASSLWAPIQRVAPLLTALPKGSQGGGGNMGGEIVRPPLKTFFACESLPPLF